MALRRTPFFELEQAAGGRFIDFGGWELPVNYTAGLKAEHCAVRANAGLFDVSHMGEIEIRGQDALAAANRLITNDLEAIVDGQALYTAMCRPDGGIVDDLVVYRFDRTRIFICCNASNRDKDFAWITENLKGAEAFDRGDEFCQLALQGPIAERLLSSLTATNLGSIGFYHFAVGQVAGVDAIISRTGYTGEDGFELYLPPEKGPQVWQALMNQGSGELLPIGLGARDTLRLEMRFALYGNDIDDTTSPIEAGLGWICKLDKPDFIGKDALVKHKVGGTERKLVAFKMDGPAIPRHGYPVLDGAGLSIGHVTSGTRSPSLDQSVGLAYVPSGQDKLGSPIRIGIRGRSETGTVVKPPFVKPSPKR